MIGGAELVVPLVAEAGKVEGVAGLAVFHANGAGAAIAGGHFFVIRRVALVHPLQLAGVQGQPVYLLGVQVNATEGLRQQPAVVVGHRGQSWLQGAEPEHAFRGAQLGGQAQFAVVVLGLAGLPVLLEQLGAAASAA
ncbi:hypothetical protein D9M71_566080 [compost metagenome]